MDPRTRMLLKLRSCRRSCGWLPERDRDGGADVDRADRDLFRRQARPRRAGGHGAGVSLFMLLQMVSAGAVGGGILVRRSARARVRGRRSAQRTRLVRRRDHDPARRADDRGGAPFGPKLYALMGGRDGSLAAAATIPRSSSPERFRCGCSIRSPR